MLTRRILVAALAAAVAIVFFPLPESTAAPFGGLGSKTASGDLVHSVQAKRKASKKKARKQKAKRKEGQGQNQNW